MKAEVIVQTVYKSFTDWSHGGGYKIQRTVVPEANNLVITIETESHGKNVYVWDNFEKDETCKLVKEINIPDELVQQVIGFVCRKNELAINFEKFLS